MKYGLTFPFCLTMLAGLAAAASVCPSLGDGYPGRIEPYTTSPSLQQHRDGFSLTAGWFRRNDPPPDQYFNPVLCPVAGNKGSELIDAVELIQ